MTFTDGTGVADDGGDAMATVARLHREWIFRWDREEGDPVFDFDAVFSDLYDTDGDDVILFDDADPQRRVLRSAHEFGRVFGPVFTALRRAEHAVEEAPSVLVSGSLAASRLVFIARLTHADGSRTGMRAFSSQVWRAGADGRWRIVRDQTAVGHLDLGETAALLAALPRR
ncbi:hypothetical protein [Pseudonocardia sp. HH130630-07]|uniref:hypothetical protein n=1 Tax=Pseudonocardia sp. HH130630-07 TaxID=1690815 RepID=UPI000839C8AC|nr:hypothetical protein [Pseudonocardia sp. HH130630-07]